MRAHAHGAGEDRFLQRAASAGVDILLGEGALGGGYLSDCLLQSAGDDAAAVQDAGLVEMDVRLYQAGDHQPPVESELRSLGGDSRLDRGDAAVADTNVHRSAGLSGEFERRGAQDQAA